MVYYLCNERTYGRQFDLMSAVGKSTRGQVEGFIFWMKPSTSLFVTVAELLRNAGCKQADDRGGAEELESSDRMALILSLKNVRKSVSPSGVLYMPVYVQRGQMV